METRQKRKRFQNEFSDIYLRQWKGLARSHAEGTETVALSSNADDTASNKTHFRQQGTTAATSTVVHIKEINFPVTAHQQHNDVDGVSDESLGKTNASAWYRYLLPNGSFSGLW
jgi:hypothetical protein